MRWQPFVDVFPRQPKMLSVPEQVIPIVKPGYDWSVQFGFALHDLLSGVPIADLAAKWVPFALRYRNWFEERFQADLDELGAFEASEHTIFLASRFFFHITNYRLLPYWDALMTGATLPSRRESKRIQLDLAVASLPWASARQRYRDEGTLYDDDFRLHLGFQRGILSEIDAAVTLVAFAREHPWVAPISGPPQFERSVRRRAADFLLLDPANREAVGVQVKTRARAEDVRFMDPKRIVVLDAATDLGDQLYDRTQPLHSDRNLVNFPGLISAHTLLEAKPGSPSTLLVDPRRLSAARSRARAVTAQTRSATTAALRSVEYRVLPHFSQTAGGRP